jgi:hypothetical protein
MQNHSVPAQQKDRRGVEDGTETWGHTMETGSPDTNECALPSSARACPNLSKVHD